MGIRGELFTNQVNLDNRSYFFNVKENRAGDVFLQIVESKIKEGLDERREIIVFADDMQQFLKGMESSLSFIEKDRKEKAKLRAQKKAEKEAKFGKGGANRTENGKIKVTRRKGESRLVAEKRAQKEAENLSGVAKTGKVHIVSIRTNKTEE